MTLDDVARIVEHRGDGTFVGLLRAADAEFDDQAFETRLADALRAQPLMTEQWATWSADQRWAPSAYVVGIETGWYDAGNRNVRVHADEAGAIADFIHRMSVWLAGREVLSIHEPNGGQ